MNHLLIEMAIEVIRDQMNVEGLSEEAQDNLQEFIYAQFGLTINGFTEEQEKELFESLKDKSTLHCKCWDEYFGEDDDYSELLKDELNG